MDHFNDACFHTWIKDPANAKTAARHLGRLMVDYGEQEVAAGLRWLFEDWQLINIAVVLRVVLVEAGQYTMAADCCQGRRERILRLVTAGWEAKHVEHLLLLLRYPANWLLNDRQ